MQTIKTKGKARLFQNPLLEALTRTHPGVILSIYLPLMGYSVYYHYSLTGNMASTAALFLAGVFTWTFAEYILHRFAFHFSSATETGRRVNYLVHGVHHEYPKDKERLIMPPVPSIIISTAFFFLFRLLMGDGVFAFLPGFIIGYLAYAIIHYSIHTFSPPNNWLRVLWKHHNIHHFRNTESAFGVSSPLWDYIFGTMPRQDR